MLASTILPPDPHAEGVGRVVARPEQELGWAAARVKRAIDADGRSRGRITTTGVPFL
jgi:hypothetical protein